MADVIQVQGLEKTFGDFRAVRGISFSVAQGECVAMLGPNGAGKTTTIEILEGLQKPSAGDVRLFGLRWDTDAEQLRGRIGVQLQETQFPPRATVFEVLELFRSFYKNGLPAEEALDLLNLRSKRDTWVSQLSGGQRQRLALATTLIGSPEIVFLDEPTTGLDPVSRRSLWDVIERLKASGKTVLLSTHYMDEAEKLCDRIIMINAGTIVLEGTPAKLVESHGGGKSLDLQLEGDAPIDALSAIPGVTHVRPQGSALRVGVNELHHALPRILQCLEQSGTKLQRLSARAPTLDDVFLAVAGQTLTGEPTTPAVEATPAS